MQLTLVGDTDQLPSVDLVGIFAFEEDLTGSGPFSLPTGGAALAELLRPSITDHRFKAKPGQTLVVDTQGRLPARRIVLVGAGPTEGFKLPDYCHLAAALARVANSIGARTLLVAREGGSGPSPLLGAPRERGVDARTAGGIRLERIAQGLHLGSYRFEKYLSADKRTPVSLETAMLVIDDATLPRKAALDALAAGQRVAAATSYARDLVNEPAGHLTPTALARDVAERARRLNLEVNILDRAACQERGMGMFLAVAQGSIQEPQFIHLAWKPPKASKRIVLVGKGVTFDSGGLSLKTNEGMLDMKSDMAGAAAVLSAIQVAAEEALPVEVHALAACTENMPSGAAYKLGDVLRSMSGRTVEINNTDAEGRLTLADALTYGLELQPDVVLDFATLTGACVVALGPHTAGVMTNDEGAVASWMGAAGAAGEDMWRLPLPARLTEQLKSEIADMRNTGERWGGALTAGLFLKEFVGKTPWIHVDIAGPATASKEWGAFSKGGTGFGVATIVEYLRSVTANGQD